MANNQSSSRTPRAARGLLLMASAVLLAPAAFAHALLDHATPAVGAEVTTAPPSLSLQYTEAVEPLFSTVAVINDQGSRVDDGKPVAQDDGRVLVVALKKLPPGVYTVEWHVTSVDTHKTNGHFTFTVKP